MDFDIVKKNLLLTQIRWKKFSAKTDALKIKLLHGRHK
jgi:hypothetical protein